MAEGRVFETHTVTYATCLSSVCSTAELWNVNWKALIDSNYRIMESKSIVLTNFTKCPLKDYKNLLILYLLLMVLRRSLELLTYDLQDRCSANWANVAFYFKQVLTKLTNLVKILLCGSGKRIRTFPRFLVTLD